MAELKYVMDDLEAALVDRIEVRGLKSAVQALTRACIEYGHSMSDMGLKENALESFEVADLLKGIQGVIRE